MPDFMIMNLLSIVSRIGSLIIIINQDESIVRTLGRNDFERIAFMTSPMLSEVLEIPLGYPQ